MRLGLLLSSAMHLALLFWALVGIHSTTPLELPKPDPITVETVTPGELAQLRQGSRTAKLEEAQPKETPSPREAPKEAPRPKPVAAEPPPPPPPPAEDTPTPPEPPKAAEAPPPAPAPKPAEQPDKEALEKKLEALALEKAAAEAAEEQRRAEAAAKAKAAAEAKAKAEADAKRKAAEEKRRRELAERRKREKEAKAKAEADAKSKSRIEPDRVAALLDKAEPKAAPAAAPPSEAPAKAKGPVKGAPDGRDRVNAANEASMLLGMIVGKVKACWNIQAGGESAAGQVPRIQFDLNRDGSLRGEPRVVNPQSSPHFQLAADAAKSAVIRCQNYDLPPDKYDLWKRVTLDFDPREMFQ